MMTGTFSSSAISKLVGSAPMRCVMKPTPNALPVRERTSAICCRSQSGPKLLVPPNVPSPPAAETAAASSPPLWLLIGADITG